MSALALRTFQETAVARGVEIFSAAKVLLDAAPDDVASRAHAINHNGYLLLEAPTGAGKTLMAGHIVERFSHVEGVIWFWFASFKGVVDQTAGYLREQFPGLRLRELHDDRAAEVSRRGDVFVTTWQTVATRVKDKRNVRKDGELNPSVDELVKRLRGEKFRVGVVVDEAHHGFHGDTQAAKFFHEVLDPEYTILITATPDDADIKEFEAKLGIAELRRTRIGRHEATAAGLIKDGVKCVAYLADAEKKALVDFEATALADGVRLHREIKKALAAAGATLTPLMLVQVDSKDDSVARVKARLLASGFTDRQVAVHTADEPDPDLLALANDEEREVLIFKMAVALGFDAPRAFTLVSMRALRDPDFGVQIVGRILRVHRRLQGRKVPELLRYGYVFLADPESQTAVDIAGQRINQVQTEYAKTSPTTVIVRVGERAEVQVLGPGGQTALFQDPPVRRTLYDVAEVAAQAVRESPQPSYALELLIESVAQAAAPTAAAVESAARSDQRAVQIVAGHFPYYLKKGVPRRFKTQILPADFDATELDCARKFMVSARDLLMAIAGRVKVQKKTLEVFTHQMTFEDIGVALVPDQVAEEAQRILTRSRVFHAKALREALVDRLQQIVREEVLEGAEDRDKIERFLDVILVTHPDLLAEAQRTALAEYTELAEADDWPETIESEQPLPASPHNAYGIVPAGLNNWETDFAGFLDRDTGGTVQWWQRNPVNKSWSVRVLLADGRGFFPDFIVGIRGRPKEHGTLLADTKYGFELRKELPKILAEHAAYGRALLLHRTGDQQWAVVRFQADSGHATLGDPFRLADAAGY
jgi:superfamily II DNA or RNA helicase